MGKTFSVDESSIYGRNHDKEAIMEKLLSVDSNGLEVISIVGMGGIGKTLFTKLVYSDFRVQNWFDIKAWVCAAAKFDILKVAKDILEEISTTNSDFKTEVLLELKERLKGKKFLLVLDDVWNDNESEWNFLLKELKSVGAQGSKIIVTTRNQNVALAFGSVHSYFLRELSDDLCWSLFAKHAFNDDYCNENCLGLEIIGREIVRKCQGLPLIAKMLGELLCYEKDVEKWQRISNNMEEVCCNYNIFMILKLSHIDLLFHLRQCLAFGIKSPKDYEFVKEKLVHKWIEEDLVRPKESEKKEEIDNYFHNLETRDIIIHDLAISISGNLFQCSISARYNEVIFGWGITVTYLVLEILLVTLEQISSPKKPHYALVALVVSLVALFICITEFAYKGQKQNIALRRQGIRCWLHRPSSNYSPYSLIDVFSLVSSICQFIFSCIAYSFLCRGAQNPIKAGFVPVIFIICMASSKLVRKPNESSLPIRRDVQI